MHTIRSLILLCCLTPLAFGQAPKTKPGVVTTVHMVVIDDAAWPELMKSILKTESVDPNIKPISLTAAGLSRTMSLLKADPSIRILTLPKITAANRQEIKVQCGDARKFTTAIERKLSGDGKIGYVPVIETIQDGLTSIVTPTITADGSNVRLRIDATYTKLKPEVPLESVTYYVTPEFEGGSQGVPVSVTQFIQKPNVDKCMVQTTILLADSSAALIDFGMINEEARMESGPTIVSQIPYFNRLFKNQSIGTVKKRLLLIPSVEIVPVDAVLEPMSDYQRAVKQGRLDDAKKHALEALAIDPACFAK